MDEIDLVVEKEGLKLLKTVDKALLKIRLNNGCDVNRWVAYRLLVNLLGESDKNCLTTLDVAHALSMGAFSAYGLDEGVALLEDAKAYLPAFNDYLLRDYPANIRSLELKAMRPKPNA
jgi:hypothetical protein